LRICPPTIFAHKCLFSENLEKKEENYPNLKKNFQNLATSAIIYQFFAKITKKSKKFQEKESLIVKIFLRRAYRRSGLPSQNKKGR
jgi:uncharacterized protein (DUF342 family)